MFHFSNEFAGKHAPFADLVQQVDQHFKRKKMAAQFQSWHDQTVQLVSGTQTELQIEAIVCCMVLTRVYSGFEHCISFALGSDLSSNLVSTSF